MTGFGYEQMDGRGSPGRAEGSAVNRVGLDYGRADPVVANLLLRRPHSRDFRQVTIYGVCVSKTWRTWRRITTAGSAAEPPHATPRAGVCGVFSAGRADGWNRNIRCGSSSARAPRAGAKAAVGRACGRSRPDYDTLRNGLSEFVGMTTPYILWAACRRSARAALRSRTAAGVRKVAFSVPAGGSFEAA